MKLSAIGFAVCAAGMLGTAAPAWSASGGDAQYREDVARCKSGATGQDREACMREAGASLVERRRNGLTTPTDPQTNATARCNALPAAQRQDCMIQMTGQGDTTVRGSVTGGGVLRETVIQVPAGTPGSTPASGYTTAPGGYTQPAAPLAPPPAVPPAGYAPSGTTAPAPYGTMPRQ
ncbi:hypothetical protein CAL13_12960 [Bordetella genomosp. 9]|uniref:Uncharacterized protein n=2 Tax=Bordetella genomosp. 9 TaxID=1416803 RepID=A0A1W6Z5R1_9BORD|nr:hypothetical protein CAL13_12960 [Bordetella genomosp. 9]ARP91007.1 hypothetical protein CAL14_12485 [Bordetella genomosp. 9]